MLVYILTHTWHPHAAMTRMYLRYESESQLHFMHTSIHFKHTRTHAHTYTQIWVSLLVLHTKTFVS